MSTPEIQCPAGIQSAQDCSAFPNTFWDGTNCHCCGTQGNSYAGSQGCLTCPANTPCGTPSPYCSGTTSAGTTCVQDPVTRTYSVKCAGGCGGSCAGSCGIGEWFAFSKCSGTLAANKCEPSVSQWKSWIVYGGILLILLLILLIVVFTGGSSKPVKLSVPAITVTSLGTPVAVQS